MNYRLLIRLLMPMILIPLFGLAPRPHKLSALIKQVEFGLRTGNFAQAAHNLAAIAEIAPTHTGLWEQAGFAALRSGNYREAVAYLDQAQQQHSLSSIGQEAMAEAYLHLGQVERAENIWLTLVQTDSGTTDVHTRLLSAHLSRKDFSAAIDDLRHLVALHPDQADYRYNLGLLLSTQQPDIAMPYLSQAVELDPTYRRNVDVISKGILRGQQEGDESYAMVENGRSLASLGEWELAATAFEQAAVLRPDYADAWAFLGEARQHLTEPDMSNVGLDELQQALVLAPTSLTANTFMALYWQRQSKYDLALEHLQAIRKEYPSNPALTAEVGSTLAMQGELSAALDAYQEAVELSSEDPFYLSQLANFCVQYEYLARDIALPAARKAVLQSPGDPFVLDTMGQVLFLLGDVNTAERYFNQVLAHDPDYPSAHIHMGLSKMLQGESAAAYQHWDYIISLDPDSAYAEQANRLISTYFD
jgi:tetratricopeptide (TPR) repeat protein